MRMKANFICSVSTPRTRPDQKGLDVETKTLYSCKYNNKCYTTCRRMGKDYEKVLTNL